MNSLHYKTPVYDKTRKMFRNVYTVALVLIGIYLFILLGAASDVISFKTFAIISVTFLIGTVIPYSTYRILDNARKYDHNQAMSEYAVIFEHKYNIRFHNQTKPKINQIAIFIDNETEEKFWGIATVDRDGKTPLLKTLQNYDKKTTKN